MHRKRFPQRRDDGFRPRRRASVAAAFHASLITVLAIPSNPAVDEPRDRFSISVTHCTAPTVTGVPPVAGAAATNLLFALQIVDEVWKVVDDNFLPARAEDGFDRARWARLRDDYTKHPPATRAEAYDVIRDNPAEPG